MNALVNPHYLMLDQGPYGVVASKNTDLLVIDSEQVEIGSEQGASNRSVGSATASKEVGGYE